MEYSFDTRGFLMPYGKNQMTFQQVEGLFVHPFEASSTRWGIFEEYRHFLLDFREQVSLHFTQWVNGSFISTRKTRRTLISLH